MQINAVERTAFRYESGRQSTGDIGFRDKLMSMMPDNTSHIVYLKKDDMLYSGGNGMGLSFYLKYAEDFTTEEPRILAKGVDENGREFEQVIDVNRINPRSATIVEMRALEAHSGAPKRNGYSSLPVGATNVGLNERQDYLAALENEIRDMNILGEYGLALENQKTLDFYKGLDKNRQTSCISDIETESKTLEAKPLWHWHDGQFGYSAEVYKNEGTESEYTVKLKYDDGREKEYVTDAEKINASDCNIVDLSVKMYHLADEGKIDNPVPQLLLAHIYMNYRIPDADMSTNVNFRSWYEQQLDLEINHNRNDKNIAMLMELLRYL